ncbi:beta-1,3-galactosyl-O-glycosyl-glycoprotein beta-1,6-N-acetylglucosaminyltransferase-like [Gigantopelta aegis]|uniref:beta-1,3-galactosyl-O-glycosyl-glycoprotein beta-1,6-N-acetylglucosaminyltransferase-like n=1 Tax=Gigantopelta aegis TaxID=1735272 RepID=UPI001B889434|nr:beta-1,3-galactosyl-O-glycosyl-glycoprotein beta-1,6-N-acetylglucosaminyltransferase-like [Gigantopelta aegis]
MIASDERTKRIGWRYLLFVIVSAFGIFSYVIIFDRTKFHELLCTINGQLVSNQFETQKIVWRNKTLLLLGRFANRCKSTEIVINKKVLEDAEAFKQRQSKENSIPQRDVVKVNCSGLITGSNATLQEVKQLMQNVKRPTIPDSYFITETKDCHMYRLKRGYFLDNMTSEEENFPIAFSILMFKHVSQVERLLRAIYRPQNYYCIHLDKKVSSNISAAVHGIANCFSNVFLTSRSVDVRWGTFTVLEPELICMQELWKYRKWKYFINLTGQEFPLKTNLDMVRILKAYNDANDIGATIKR